MLYAIILMQQQIKVDVVRLNFDSIVSFDDSRTIIKAMFET